MKDRSPSRTTIWEGSTSGIPDKASKQEVGDFAMKVPASVMPAVWGVIGGAIAAIVIGFVWGGWVTGGKAGKMETASAEAAVVLAFTPLCVAKAEQQPEQRVLLKKEGKWQRDDFVVKAGWVDNLSIKYRYAVAEACALTVVEGMKAEIGNSL
jgi:hypothetical protein